MYNRPPDPAQEPPERIKTMKEKFILCPRCGHKTRDKLREDTVLENFPVFCPKCKRETLVNIENFKMTIVNEPAAKPQCY